MPVTGIKRIFIPMLMKTWQNNSVTTPTASKLAQAIARLAGNFDPAKQEHRIKRQDHDAADKAFLLGDDREDEIIVCSGLRQETQRILGALPPAFSCQSPRTDGNQRLLDVVASPFCLRPK